MELNLLPTAQALLEQDLDQAAAWIEDHRAEAAANPNWWLGLAQGAAAKAFAPSGSIDIHWAALAVQVYEMLDASLPNHCASCIESAMLIRVRLIKALGNQPHHPLLDAEVVVRWFWEHLPISAGEAASKVALGLARLYSSQPDDLVRLRMAKNRLNIVKQLVDDGKLQPDAALSQWLTLRDKLP